MAQAPGGWRLALRSGRPRRPRARWAARRQGCCTADERLLCGSKAEVAGGRGGTGAVLAGADAALAAAAAAPAPAAAATAAAAAAVGTAAAALSRRPAELQGEARCSSSRAAACCVRTCESRRRGTGQQVAADPRNDPRQEGGHTAGKKALPPDFPGRHAFRDVEAAPGCRPTQ
eukprot:354465-Chlamydomonas_euryale.AAC.2